MNQVLFENARLFDGVSREAPEGMQVLVAEGAIQEVSAHPVHAPEAQRIDCRGKTLMPGMIDCHVHIYAASLEPVTIARPRSWFALHAARFVRHILDCGFTTIRDVAGGDIGMQLALEDGFLNGPRYLYGGLALSQTGGHGDLRAPHMEADINLCACGGMGGGWFAHLVDGPDQCLKATREELRKGASHIKIMASGGIVTPSDSLENLQFSDAEITTVVEECTRHGKYVAAHCHPDAAIRRCTKLGVRTIEHGTMIGPETAELVARTGNYLIPTLAPLTALEQQLSGACLEKLRIVANKAIEGLENMRRAGCKIGFGSDLLADRYIDQGTEFTLRREVFDNWEILHQATAASAEALCLEDRIGRVAPGLVADLLVVDGNPLEDIGILAANGARLTHIMQAGRFHKGG
jgi:imidazolonepropionase-like amidohydrolase